MKRLAITIAAVAVVITACGGSGAGDTTTPATEPPAAADVTVSIASFAFGPDTVTVPVGTTVTWTNNEESVPHTSTSDDGLWDSATLDPGESFSFTFDEPGTYAYTCRFHPSMTAVIVVEG